MSTTTSDKTLRADQMKIRYRAEKLGLEPLGNHGRFTFVETTEALTCGDTTSRSPSP